jgi:predicted Fe-Mo cluster-binding NifX family protein
MRTAITSTGNDAESTIDQRFGRCSFFIIFDSETMSVEYIPNPYKNSEENAGEESVKLLVTNEVNRIISGEFGLKIKPLLDRLKIQMIVIRDHDRKLSEILDMLKKNI